MVLFENSVLVMNYDPATDIAVAEYPDLHDYLLPEIKYSIDRLVEMIRNYDIKKLLLDSTKTVISVGAEESREVATYLTTGIMRTRVVKVARIQSPSVMVENFAKGNISYIRERHQLPFQLQNFTSKAVAVEWLQS